MDFNYSMLLVRPWLRDTKVAHDWSNNMVIIQGNGTIRTITANKHLEVMLSDLKHCCVMTFTIA